jgi:hypothetical protein
LQHLLPSLEGYIWQRDRFALHASARRRAPWQRAAGAGGALPPHLWGSLGFGDNVEDEWFVVWLLLELTRAFPVTARAWDNDGEFVLIEAAYALPRWLKPETAANRVWLHAGALHVVPLPRVAGDAALPAAPTAAQALALVRGGAVDTLAPGARVAAGLAGRLAGYPARARALMHRAAAVLPARVAHLLAREPQLAAAAVEAFHCRDPGDVRAAARMAAVPPADPVPASVALSRCLYAQVALQQYRPPKGWPPLPPPSDPAAAAAELGLKLTAGFEMLLAANPSSYEGAAGGDQGDAAAGEGEGEGEGGGGGGGGGSAAVSELSDAALLLDPGWRAYASRLQALGYFGGELEGSAAHAAATAAAAAEYRRTEAYREATRALAAPARRVRALLVAAPPPDVGALRAAAAAAPPPDGEAWLREGSAQIDAELAQRQREADEYQARRAAKRGRGGEGGGGGGGAKGHDPGEFDPTALTSQLRGFVEAAAGLAGAEVPDGDVAFDEARFAQELRRVLGVAAPPGGAAAARARGGGDDSDGVSSHTSEEGSSFFSGSSSGGGSSDEEPARPPRAAGRGPASWEARTATDSDDDDRDADFLEGYSRALDQQLGATSMAETFVRADDVDGGGQPAAGAEPEAAAAAAAADAEVAAVGGGDESGGGSEGGESEGEGAGLRPVDVDINLVSSLLASYREQGGLPGPASNLAGLLGVKLPDPGTL